MLIEIQSIINGRYILFTCCFYLMICFSKLWMTSKLQKVYCTFLTLDFFSIYCIFSLYIGCLVFHYDKNNNLLINKTIYFLYYFLKIKIVNSTPRSRMLLSHNLFIETCYPVRFVIAVLISWDLKNIIWVISLLTDLSIIASRH